MPGAIFSWSWFRRIRKLFLINYNIQISKKMDMTNKKKGKTVDLSSYKTFKEKTETKKAEETSEKKAVQKPRGFSKIIRAIKENRVWQVVLIIIGVLLIASLTYAAQVFLFQEKKKEEPKPEQEVVEKKEVENEMARKTDGVIMSDLNETNKYPVAIMIENLSVVRPQAGLSLANIVYETLAEGGITRFMAIFAGDPAKEIHPVRSARPYYIEWVEEYKALYGHAGGSPQALEAISGLKVNDLNGLGNDGKYFWRGAGFAPHNLYTSTTLIERAVRDKGLENAKFDSWKFTDDSVQENVSLKQTITLDFSSGSYNVKYSYDKEKNCYQRFHIDEPHNERLTGEQLCPKNVIVQIVPPATSAGEKGRIELNVTGEGEVAIYRNGEEIKGKWKKESREARTKFYDAEDKEIKLARGQVWIEVLPSDRNYQYQTE